MKTIRIFLLVLIVAGVALIATQKVWVPKLIERILSSEHAVLPEAVDEDSVSFTDGKYCFSRTQKAELSMPYAVEEEIVLEIKGSSVLGTKRGIQSGPDMMNGYEGSLTGTREGNSLELLYSYTVEGSDNKELEMYELSDASIVKMRRPLKPENGILVPDKAGKLQMLLYKEKNCEL